MHLRHRNAFVTLASRLHKVSLEGTRLPFCAYLERTPE
jgi:hypothetical protein